MKKKTVYLIVVALIVANVFFSTTPTRSKESDLTLVLLEARADGPGETDPPEEEFPPLRPSPTDWSLSAIIDYLF